MIEIRRYKENDEQSWSAFLDTAKNATFLFERRYMDYHKQRFHDHSLMFFLDGKLIALLPANADGETFFSHTGLTYGGLIMSNDCHAEDVLEIFVSLKKYLAEHHFKQVVYKAIPAIYHRVPAEEDLYALFRVCNARLISRDISSTIIEERPVKWRRDRRYGANKAHTNGITVERDEDYADFWQILQDNLSNKYGANPVHSLDEMLLLKSRFPDNILLYTARLEGEMLGGTVLYAASQVLHAQYISASARGKHLHAIDAIFSYVLNNVACDYKYFDFGKSTEDNGNFLNSSLIYQKEGFGGRAICYDTYLFDV